MDAMEEANLSKKHKKHKHKKHKKKKSHENHDINSVNVVIDDECALKLKSKSPVTVQEKIRTSNKDTVKSSNSSGLGPKQNNLKKKKNKSRDSGTSSEEERWLDAIESGKLEDVDDELKKIKPKDPKLMTARQRAMYERGNDKESSPGGETLLALPSGYKEKVMTAEAIQKAALKSQKRKQMADEKREQDKKRTMERLLKKQETKMNKGARMKPTKRSLPVITYKSTTSAITVSFPVGFDYPLKQKDAPPVPIPVKCGVAGCNNISVYACSKTNVRLCSLKCYKRNITAHILS